MYEDNYITQDQLKRAFADGLMLKLQSPKIDIKAPHFVFFIRDLLLNGDTRFKDLGITEEILYQ
jgi:membrane carboxypeptidase/penicillin-binding protein